MHAAHFSFLQNVAPKAGTAVTTQEGAPPAAGGGAPPQQAAPAQSPLSMLFPFIILIPFIWMMFRRQKKEQQERAKLKKGDKVATQAGLVGELVELGEQTSKLKVAAGVTIEVLSSSLMPFVQPAPKKDEIKADAKVAAEKK